jgi:secondary thiamine-phosphate synthase enzyme
MIKRGLTLLSAMHIAASVVINDDESGLHHDNEVWLEKLAPHAPIDQYRHNRTGEDNADAHLKRQIMGREVVVAVTNGRLDGRALLTRTFGTWERIFQGQAEWLARESRRPAAEPGTGQDHRRVGAISSQGQTSCLPSTAGLTFVVS